MTIPRPGFYFNFANTPDFLDPRLVFQRNSVATYIDATGKVATAPAGAPRWEFDPDTGECKGVVIEGRRANKVQFSEDFGNAAWVKQNTTVSTNTSTAPDGNVTADTATVTSASAVVFTTVTLTSTGNSLVCSVFAKSNATDHLLMRVSDGTDFVSCWFNLTSQTVGTNTTGNTNCSFAAKTIQPLPNGWSRCSLAVNTAVNSTYYLALTPTAADNTGGVATNSVFLWGAQAEEQGTLTNLTSYIPVASSTAVTREADNLYLPISTTTDKWFNKSEGTLFFEWVCRDTPNSTGVVYGGIGHNSNDNIYVARQTSSLLIVRTVVSTGVSVVVSDIYPSYTYPTDSPTKLVIAWGSTSVETVINAGSVFAVSTNTPTPSTTVRASLFFPQSASVTTNGVPFANYKSFAYFPKKLSDTEMKLLTS
jgi:hypothetical protein